MELTDGIRNELKRRVEVCRRGMLPTVAVHVGTLAALLKSEEDARAAVAGMRASNQRLRASNAALEAEAMRLRTLLDEAANKGQVFACQKFQLQRRVEQQADELRCVADELVRLSSMDVVQQPNRLAMPVPELEPLPAAPPMLT